VDAKEFTDYIVSKTVKRIEFAAKELPLFNKYVVYMANSKNECLYVGMSTKGLSRVFGKGHHVLASIYDDITSIQVYETRTEEDARELESTMIQEFKPKYNDRQCTRSVRTVRNKQGKGATAVIASIYHAIN
jgi:excinuclease UvrABC nuclease subunit